MKTLARTLTTIMLAMAMAIPPAFADNNRTSGNRNGNHREHPTAVNRNHSSERQRTHGQHNSRPAGKHNKKQYGNQNRHDNKDYSRHNKKDYYRHENHNYKPNHSDYRYPVGNRHNPPVPYKNYRHYGKPVHSAGYGPKRPPHHPPMMKPPHRPYRPIPGPWHRPIRPKYWCAAPHAPMLSTILGVAFGTAINLTINQLINNGYNVSGYNTNTIYLTDVNQAGYFWPDATFYYNAGLLDRSEFFYTSPYNDNRRYGALYNTFTTRYGYPVNVINSPMNMSATWFAPDRGYITLQYGPGASMSLPGRFVTTLTVGI